MTEARRVLPWVARLTGLDPSRCEAALNDVASWKIAHVTAEFVDTPTVDAVVGSVFLSEGVAALTERGVARARLMKKLRGDRDCWPTWAEIRAAVMLATQLEAEVRLEIEPNRAGGKHPDFRFTLPDGLDGTSVEFKAIGLSDAEVAFCAQAAEHLDHLLPPIGLSTLHAGIDARIRVSDSKREKAWRESRRLEKQLPDHARGFSGISIVGHGTDNSYIKRLGVRIEEALAQLPSSDECWVAFYWSNGAPMVAIHPALRAIDFPSHVAGVVALGSGVAFPWPEIHCFHFVMPREFSEEGDTVVQSELDDDLARRVLERFESSSGVRPTLMRVAENEGPELLRRDGKRRILPFNLLFDADPPELAVWPRPPSPVQRTTLIS